MKSKFPILFFTCFLFLSCVGKIPPSEQAQQIATKNQFKFELINSSEFDLTAYCRTANKADKIVIYIEGDGKAWLSRYRPSLDPSPTTPTALKLAILDPAPSVIYLARPCQYTGGIEARNCGIPCWTSDRFSLKIINAMNEAISILKSQYMATEIHLVGYSGGGGIAVILGSMRNDIASIRTVAGNLDHAAWTAWHKLTPMTGSLNAVNYAGQTYNIPQIHYVGKKDSIIPIEIANSYMQKLPKTNTASILEVTECTHSDGWEQVWPQLCSEFYKNISK